MKQVSDFARLLLLDEWSGGVILLGDFGIFFIFENLLLTETSPNCNSKEDHTGVYFKEAIKTASDRSCGSYINAIDFSFKLLHRCALTPMARLNIVRYGYSGGCTFDFSSDLISMDVVWALGA